MTAPKSFVSVTDPGRGPDAPRPGGGAAASPPEGDGVPAAGAGPVGVRRGTATARVTNVRALPLRWFPADRAKLIYLSIAAHTGPRVLAELVTLADGAWFEDRDALHRALAAGSTP